MASSKNYINGLFAQTFEGKYGPFTIIRGDDSALKQIHKLPRDEDGRFILFASPQKADPAKLSIYEGEHQQRQAPQRQQRGGYGKPKGGYNRGKQDSEDELPF